MGSVKELFSCDEVAWHMEANVNSRSKSDYENVVPSMPTHSLLAFPALLRLQDGYMSMSMSIESRGHKFFRSGAFPI